MASRLAVEPLSVMLAGLVLASLGACEPFLPPAISPGGGGNSTPWATLVPIPTPTPRDEPAELPARLSIAPLTEDPVGRFELLELEVLTDIVPTNPFDPDEFEIRVEFITPSGRAADVGAFWYQAFTAQTKPVSEPGWRVRFTPTETGTWKAIARVPIFDIQSEPIEFRVVPTESLGFVRIHPRNPRYFAFDNGDFFFPIGLNMAWWSGAGNAITDYRRWMDLFAANGGNTVRVWMAEWSFGIEWNDTPLGDYDRRLARAWMLDQIFDMAEDQDIYVILVLLNCADFNDWQTNGWNGNPYNAARGGPLERPDQFVTDPTARALTQRKLNYIVSRWGYSPHLLAWEWWNEVILSPFSDETLIPWLQEMTAYLRERDVNRHLTTNSYAIRDISPIWQMPELDAIQKHEYADQVRTTDRDITGRAAPDLENLAASVPPKPILLGEFGYGAEANADQVEKSGIYLHNGLWATTFAGYAGSGMYWYWDGYVEANRLWHHYRSLDRFLTGLDLSQYQPFSPLEIAGPRGIPAQALGLGLRGDDVLIWLRSNAYTTQASVAAREAAGSPAVFSYLPPIVEGQRLTLRNMDDGRYSVQWYDPPTATWLDPVEVAAQRNQLSIPVPAFRRDLAARIVANR